MAQSDIRAAGICNVEPVSTIGAAVQTGAYGPLRTSVTLPNAARSDRIAVIG